MEGGGSEIDVWRIERSVFLQPLYLLTQID